MTTTATLTQAATDATEALLQIKRAVRLAGEAKALLINSDTVVWDAAVQFENVLQDELTRVQAVRDAAVKAANTASRNARMIDKLTPGQTVTLRFHGRYREDDSEMVFVGITGKGDERRATFLDGTTEWDAYRYNGMWAYGSGAERLSIVTD